MLAHDIPVAHTPDGGWHGDMPAPVLAACTEPLATGASDLRGLWKAYKVEQGGERLASHPLNQHVERIEQCGNRIVITAGGVVHDMRADGTLEHGVDDVAAANTAQRIHVAAVFKDGRLELHPGGIDPARRPLVTREIVNGELVWNYAVFTVTLRKAGAPGDQS